MNDLTIDAWRAEIARLGGPPNADGLTVKEFAAEAGYGRTTAVEILKKGVKEGRYIAGIGQRQDSGGRFQRVTVYRIEKGK